MTVRKIYGMIQHASGQAAFPSGHPEMLLVRIWSGAKNGTDVRRIVSPYFRSVIQKTDLWAGGRWTADGQRSLQQRSAGSYS